MVERMLRWNRFTDTGEQERLRHRYVFAIINEPREIERIKQRIIEQLGPADDFTHISYTPLHRTNGLCCMVFSVASEKARIEHPERIYDNLEQFRRDRNLRDITERNLLRYLERLVS